MTENTAIWHTAVDGIALPPLVDVTPIMKGVPMMQFFVDQYHQVGPIFRVELMGKPFTVLVGPQANLFLSRTASEYLTGATFWQKFDEQMEFDNSPRDSEAHSEMRKIKRNGYSRSAIVNHVPQMVEMTQQALTHWLTAEHIPLVSFLQHVVADQLGLFLNGHVPGDYFDDILLYIHTLIKATLTHQLPSTALSSPEFLHAKSRVAELGHTVIEANRIQSHPDQEINNHIDGILAAVARGEPLLVGKNLDFAALGPFAAGLDTVANTCAFMLYALLKHPELYVRVVSEIDQAMSEGPLSSEKLMTMTALHGAAMETLRMYPVAPMLQYNAKQSFVFANRRIEAGESIMVATTATHLMPEFYPNPEIFDIDRYNEPRNEHRQPGAFAPFGLGTHTCLGAGIAEMQTMIIPAALLYRAEFALEPPDYELRITADPTLTAGVGLQVRIAALRHVS